MAYTTIDKPSDYFNTVLRSGLYGGSDTAFTVGFQPDLIWDKRRSGTSVHALFDSVRGFGSSGKVLYSNTADAEATNALIKSVSSTGFTVTASSDNTGTLVDWCWKAGTSFTNDASATGIGSIDSSGSASDTAGFSIVSWSGTGSAGTLKHGLSSTPKMIIVKNRGAGEIWVVYHKSLGATKFLRLAGTEAVQTLSTVFNDTEPTSSVFSVGTNEASNRSGYNMIAYCFAEKQGYSKFGSYISNGVSGKGTYVHLGFKPAFVIHKQVSTTGDWRSWNNKSSLFNQNNKSLFPNTTDSEYDTASVGVDFLSNGIKWRQTDTVNNNPSGGTFIFMAFAENPFVTSTGVPTTAR